MNFFYAPDIISTGIYTLPENEFAHVRVLRLKVNDAISLTNGRGDFFEGKIVSITKKRCSIEVITRQHVEDFTNCNLHIAIAPTKNISRFEWFVEKAVEMGIARISPIITRYSERRTINYQRIDKCIISALKQSMRVYKPKLHSLVDFSDFVLQENSGSKYIAYCKAEEGIKNFDIQGDATFMIGPEGGFSDFEIQQAIANNFIPVKINQFRLRTETAGVFVAASVNYANQ